MTRLSLASGSTSISGGSICKAPSPERNTTRLCLMRSWA